MVKRKTAGTVNDPTIRFAVLKIDEKDYSVCYDFGAIAEAEKATGANLLQGLAALLLDSATANQYLGLFFAGLRKAQPELTLDEAARLVRIDTMPDIRFALVQAYNLSMPEKKRMKIDLVEEGSPLPTPNSGMNAGLSPDSI